MKELRKCRKAFIPLVVVIILIAVTNAWLGALTFTFMATEELTFTTYTWNMTNDQIEITVKNTGTSSLTISEIRVNDATNSSAGWTQTDTPPLDAGQSTTFTITGSAYFTGGYVSGTEYAFLVITAKDNQFGPYSTTAPVSAHFTLDIPETEPFPTWIVAAIVILASFGTGLYAFKIRKER